MTQTAAAQTHSFQTEVKQLLQLMIHSLYSNKEVFLRELISNGSDACDRLRFAALTDAGLVARLDLGDSLRRFELLKSGTDGFSQHPHFMCVSCGSVSCMDDHSFKIKANNRNATAPGEIQEVLLKGRCSSCQ